MVGRVALSGRTSLETQRLVAYGPGELPTVRTRRDTAVPHATLEDSIYRFPHSGTEALGLPSVSAEALN